MTAMQNDDLSAGLAEFQAQTRREQAAASLLDEVERWEKSEALTSPFSAMPEQPRREQAEPSGESWAEKAGGSTYRTASLTSSPDP